MDSFKTSFAEFLVSYWENDEFSPFFENKQLFVNCEDKCFKFFAERNCVVTAEIEELFSTHEEADSRMLFHVYYIPAPSEIVIRTVDTDVLIIALGVMDQLNPRKVLWLEAGVQGKTCYNIFRSRKSSKILAKCLSRFLLALHALTSCDYKSPSSGLAPKAIDISTSEEGNDDDLECDINGSGISFKIL